MSLLKWTPVAILALLKCSSVTLAQTSPVYTTQYSGVYTYNEGDNVPLDAGTGVPVYLLEYAGTESTSACQLICDQSTICLGTYEFVPPRASGGYCYTMSLTSPPNPDNRQVYELATFEAYDLEEATWRYSNLCNPALGDELRANGQCHCGFGRMQDPSNRRICRLATSGLVRRKSRRDMDRVREQIERRLTHMQGRQQQPGLGQ